MRKVTQQIADAFKRYEKLKVGNTATCGESITLHGNYIVERDPWGNISMTLAGYNTQTTRERLNGIAEALGLNARFTQRDGWPCLNDEPIQADCWYTVHAKFASRSS
jgi:hypothetical protein